MSWIYLILAGLFEIGWPLGFKLSQTGPQSGSKMLAWISFSVASMAASGFFLWLAQRSIPIGTAYAVWTGIGAVGTVLIGILFFKEPVSFGRLFFIFTLIVSIIGLKVVSS